MSVLWHPKGGDVDEEASAPPAAPRDGEDVLRLRPTKSLLGSLGNAKAVGAGPALESLESMTNCLTPPPSARSVPPFTSSSPCSHHLPRRLGSPL